MKRRPMEQQWRVSGSSSHARVRYKIARGKRRFGSPSANLSRRTLEPARNPPERVGEISTVPITICQTVECTEGSSGVPWLFPIVQLARRPESAENPDLRITYDHLSYISWRTRYRRYDVPCAWADTADEWADRPIGRPAYQRTIRTIFFRRIEQRAEGSICSQLVCVAMRLRGLDCSSGNRRGMRKRGDARTGTWSFLGRKREGMRKRGNAQAGTWLFLRQEKRDA